MEFHPIPAEDLMLKSGCKRIIMDMSKPPLYHHRVLWLLWRIPWEQIMLSQGKVIIWAMK